MYKQYLDNFHIMTLLTRAQLKSRYRKTFAGFVWVVLNPMLSFLVQALLFKEILKVNTEHYFTFLLSGIIPWIFISSSLTMTANLFISQRSTFLAFKFNPIIYLGSQVLDNFINFITSYLILLVLIRVDLLFSLPTIILFLIFSFGLFLFIFFSCFLVAILQVFFRDTQFILQFFLNLAYFITPIFYPFSLLPENLKKIVIFNPLVYVIRPFQNLFWDGDNLKAITSFLYLVIMNIVLMLAAYLIWNKNKNELYYKI